MKLSLKRWAERHFDPPPALATLRRWANTGQIVPAPVKVGRMLMCDEHATYRPLPEPGTPHAAMSERAKRILDAAQKT